MAKLPKKYVVGISSERMTTTLNQIKSTLDKYCISNEDAKSISIAIQNAMVMEAKY